MTAKQIDYVNIGLMVFAFFVSIKLPFHLFLMAYAILGPLHYLTEIGWLDDKNYFSTNKRDAWILVVLCALVTLAFSIYQFGSFEFTKTWTESLNQSKFKPIADFILKYEKSFIFLAFYAAIMMTFVKKKALRYGLMAAGIVIAYFLNGINAYFMIIGIMLPTVIHVYVFTGAFILFGALKSKSVSGYASLMVFVLILFLIVMQRPKPQDYQLTGYWLDTMKASNFHGINQAIASFFGWNKGTFYVFSPLGIKMQIFIAFAYTYHYLNWFSKTKIINWHQVSKVRLYSAVAIWIASVALYFYDYKIGLAALFFLSVLHVFLEFPLNHLTFVGIFKELKSRIIP
ncbi:MAG: hypothetical protein RLZZ337_198 [Bacteroidota bacterium]|jgi:hypothetical protein